MTRPKSEITGSDIAVAAHEAAVRNGVGAVPRVIGEYNSKHVFRSERAGLHRGLKYTIDACKPTWLDPDDDPVSRRIGRVSLQRWKERYTDEEQANLEQAVIDNGGARKIRFKYVGLKSGATGHVEYETDSDAIAAVLKRAIGKGELPGIAYIDQSKYLKVGDKAFATNEGGWKLAQAEATASGNSIEIITKDA